MNLSVVVPTHNVEEWVAECLRSILRQDVPGMEVIVVDDQSTDATPELVSSFVASDPRVRLVHSEARGGGSARNTGTQLARGRYLMFADGDDLVPEGAYALLFDSLERSGSDMAIGNVLKFSPTRSWEPNAAWGMFDSAVTGIQLRDNHMLIHARACWNRMFRRSFWDAAGPVFPDSLRSNDIAPMIKALTSARLIDVLEEPVYLYRQRPGAGSMTSKAHQAQSYVDYVTQESRCLAMLQSYGDQRTLDEYFSMFFTVDGWNHLNGFLKAGAFPSSENMQRAQHIVRGMIADCPPEVWEKASLKQKNHFTLFSVGVPALAPFISGAASGEPLRNATENLVSQLAARPPAGYDSDDLGISELVRSLLSSTSPLDDELYEAMTSLLAHSLEVIAPARPQGWGAPESQFLDACARRSAADVRWLSTAGQYERPTARVAKTSGRALSLELEIPAQHEADEITLCLVARESGRTVRFPVRTTDERKSVIKADASVKLRRLNSPDVWDSYVEFARGDVTFLTPLGSDTADPQRPAGRGPRLIALPNRWAGRMMSFENRSHFAVRGAKKAARAFYNVLSTAR